jgi:hypothetical protein
VTVQARDQNPSTKETDVYDMKNLAKFKRLGELAPEAYRSFVEFDAAAFANGVIPPSTRS